MESKHIWFWATVYVGHMESDGKSITIPISLLISIPILCIQMVHFMPLSSLFFYFVLFFSLSLSLLLGSIWRSHSPVISLFIRCQLNAKQKRPIQCVYVYMYSCTIINVIKSRRAKAETEAVRSVYIFE